MKKNILVVGGSGFIGQEVVKVLRQHNQVVSTSQSIPADGEGAEHHILPYTQENFQTLMAGRGFDSALFLSGNAYPGMTHDKPLTELDVSTRPFIGLLEAVRAVSPKTSVWFASSVAVYGANSENPLSEEAACRPLSFYAATKLANEEYAKVYTRTFDIRTGILRIFSTYGPGLRRQLIFDLMSKILANPKEISLFGDGYEARDLGYVTDQARAIALLATTQQPKGDVYNIGSGQMYTVNEVVERLCGLCNVKPNVIYQGRRGFDGSSWCADVRKLHSLGFRPEFDLDRGLAATLQDFRAYASRR